MPLQDFPQLGHVIRSSAFAFAYWPSHDNKKVLYVDGRTRRMIVQVELSTSESHEQAIQTGVMPERWQEVDLAVYDESRGNALFVVEEARLTGGESDLRGGRYPDGWRVRARRLGTDDLYDPSGELIEFYLSESFVHKLDPQEVEIVGKMQMRFV